MYLGVLVWGSGYRVGGIYSGMGSGVSIRVCDLGYTFGYGIWGIDSGADTRVWSLG